MDESALSGVPQIARAYAMPAFAIDRHTNRGRHCLDTTARLKGHCDTLQLPLPCDAWKSHGPSPHAPHRMGFEEFVEHVQRCERENGGGRAPLFAEEALALYRQQDPGRRKRVAVVERMLALDDGSPSRPPPPKKNPKRGTLPGTATSSTTTTTTTARSTADKKTLRRWIGGQQPSTIGSEVRWHELPSRFPMAQLPAGGKPAVFVDFEEERVIKGPFSNCSSPLRSACLTCLARDALRLSACVPEVLAFADEATEQIGLTSPMIGRREPAASTFAAGPKAMSDNADRGMQKLYDYFASSGSRRLGNPLDLLKIVVAKAALGSADNNTSNAVVVLNDAEVRDGERRPPPPPPRVYGLDFGGRADFAKLAENAARAARQSPPTISWAFSKTPRKEVMRRIDELANAGSTGMSAWLLELQSAAGLRRFEDVCRAFPAGVAPAIEDYSHALSLFVAHFARLHRRPDAATGPAAAACRPR